MFGKLKYLRISHHIFQLEAIATVSSCAIEGRYEITINYNGGPMVIVHLETKEELNRSMDKIQKALKAI